MFLIKSIKLAGADIKRMFKTPKIYLVFLFVLFFLDNYAKGIKSLAAGLHLGIAPYVYPVYMSEWRSRVFALILMVAIMSDAPFKNGSERYLFLKASKNEWILSKIFYIIFGAALLQASFVVISVAVCFPYIGFSRKWGDIITMISNGMAGNMETGAGYTESASKIVSDYTPLSALFQQIMTGFLMCIVIGFTIMLINIAFRNYAGTVAVTALLLIEYFISVFDWVKPVGRVIYYTPGALIALDKFKRCGGMLSCAEIVCLLSGLSIILAALLFVEVKINRYRIMEM